MIPQGPEWSRWRRTRAPEPGLHDDQPETPSQAASFDRRRRRYFDAGLCHHCAAQAAYGHAQGWSRVETPCPICVPVMALLPIRKVRGWRALRPDGGYGVTHSGSDPTVSEMASRKPTTSGRTDQIAALDREPA